MKTTLSILALSVLLLAECVPPPKERDNKGISSYWDVIVIDSCEYIYMTNFHQGFLAHKGNCKYCEQRRKEELK